MFKLQVKSNGVWKDLKFGPIFDTQNEAMEYAKSLDEDGIFNPNAVRIVLA